jgi:hypothetical protein
VTRDEYIAMAAHGIVKGWMGFLATQASDSTREQAIKYATAALDAVSSWETRERAEKLLDELFEDRSERAHDCTVECRVCSASASLGAVLDKVGK